MTVLAVPAIGIALEARAAELVGSLLPVIVRPSGLVLFGGEQVTIARVLDVPAALTRAVLALRDGVVGERHQGWVPHLTLARRVPRRDTQRALDALGYDDLELVLTGLRRWDPEQRTVRPL